MLTIRVGGPADAAGTARLWTAAHVARLAALGLPSVPVAGATPPAAPSATPSAAEDRVRDRLAGPSTVLVLAFSANRDNGKTESSDRGNIDAENGSPGNGDSESDDPVAMALVVQALDRDGTSTEPLPGVAHVSMIAVHPSRWGQRLGSTVLERAQLEARQVGYTRAQLWTHETNTRAQRVYERLGWTPSGRTTTDEHGEQIRHYTRDL